MGNFQGGCRCGDVRFAVSSDPLGGVACHCRDCQYASGGSANISWIFDAAGFEIVSGEPNCFKAEPTSGGSYFCTACGTPVFSRPDKNDHLVAIKVGAFDDAEGVAVQADIWMSSAPSWHQAHHGAKRFDQNYLDDQR